MAQNAPTKGNLIAAKRSRALAQNGYELMDKKRNILIRELMTLIDEAGKLKERIDSTFTEAYASLRLANISMGGCEDIARATKIAVTRVDERSLADHTDSVRSTGVPHEVGDLHVLERLSALYEAVLLFLCWFSLPPGHEL